MAGKVYIVEGYDMVGKSYFLNNILKERYERDDEYIVLQDFKSKFGYVDNKYGISTKQAWLIGASWIHMLVNMKNSGNLNCDVYIDRGILSNVAYDGDNEYLRTHYISDMRVLDAKVLYLKHGNLASAKTNYQMSKVDSGRTNDRFDDFKSFEDYMKSYENYDKKFMKAVEYLKSQDVSVDILMMRNSRRVI